MVLHGFVSRNQKICFFSKKPEHIIKNRRFPAIDNIYVFFTFIDEKPCRTIMKLLQKASFETKIHISETKSHLYHPTLSNSL